MPSFALSSHVKIHIKGRDLCGNWKTRALDLDSQTVPSVTVLLLKDFYPVFQSLQKDHLSMVGFLFIKHLE